MTDSRVEQVQQAMTRRVQRKTVAKGELVLPAVPGMVDEYVELCDRTFALLGAEFSEEQLAHLRSVLLEQLEASFKASQRSDILISYNSPNGLVVNYNVKPQWWSVADAYNNWVATRKPPLFGTEPDARVWALATRSADPGSYPVLDIGAGTGRNSIALARRGHPVDAVEMTEKFADAIRLEAQQNSLDIRVIQRDVFTTLEDLRRDYQLILLSEVTPDFRTADQLRSMCELAASCLAPGGQLVFNIFLPRGDYVPDAAAREFGQQCYSGMFTYQEMTDAAAGLPLELIDDVSVYDYEKTHLAPEAWPPTSWYANWVSGMDVFEVSREESPIEMRWLVYRKTAQ